MWVAQLPWRGVKHVELKLKAALFTWLQYCIFNIVLSLVKSNYVFLPQPRERKEVRSVGSSGVPVPVSCNGPDEMR